MLNHAAASIKPFHATSLFKYPLKTSENLWFSSGFFWCFQGLSKKTSGMKWVMLYIITDSLMTLTTNLPKSTSGIPDNIWLDNISSDFIIFDLTLIDSGSWNSKSSFVKALKRKVDNIEIKVFQYKFSDASKWQSYDVFRFHVLPNLDWIQRITHLSPVYNFWSIIM